MAKIIQHRHIVEDAWQVLRLDSEVDLSVASLPDGDWLLPLSVWQRRKQEVISRYKTIGVWLAGDTDLATIAPDLHYFRVIAIDFPKFSDGRGFSLARLLREEYGYEGEIRAIGDVGQDQLFYLKRCGFDSFALREDKDIDAALAALDTFPEAYQAAVDQPQPLFRRRIVGTPKLISIDASLDASVREKATQALELLARIGRDYAPAVLASSLSAEDMVLTDLILRAELPIEIFSLDTGRLPAETYDLIADVEKHYGHRLKLFAPRGDLLEAYVRDNGVNGFYNSVEQRKACCHVRKVEPLQRALAGKKAWITGMRAQQSATRTELPVQTFDAANGLEKFNPLSDWSEREVWAYIRAHAVPYNALHDRFFPSIGCAPCTRAVTPGEDVRAGRWWWEDATTKECGLHIAKVSK